MALKASTRAAVFDVVKARVEAATGATYDERITVGQIPNGRASHFCIGKRKTKRLDPRQERQATGDAPVAMVTTYPIEYAHRVKPQDRETRRAAVDAVVDAMQEKGTSNTAGIETRWLSDDEDEVPSGEWIVIRGVVEARWQFAGT